MRSKLLNAIVIQRASYLTIADAADHNVMQITSAIENRATPVVTGLTATPLNTLFDAIRKKFRRRIRVVRLNIRIRSVQGWYRMPRSKKSRGTPGGIRTPDQRLRRPLLYPAELLAHWVCKRNGRGDRIRTCDPLLPKQMRYQAAPCPDSDTASPRYRQAAGP